MVYHAEGTAGGLTIADEFAVDRLLLRVQVVVQDLIEALQANAVCFLLLVIANRGAAPNALDHEQFVFLFFFHNLSVASPG